MKKKLLIPIFINLSFASNFNYLLHTNHAFLQTPGKKEIVVEYQKLNDTVDILNIRDSELKNNSFGSIGDLDGFRFSLRYGIDDKKTLISNISTQFIDYTSSNKLKNTNFEIIGRYQLFFNEYTNTAASMDLGGVINKAGDISIDEPKYLETLAKRFFNIKDVKVIKNKIGIVKNSGETVILNLKSDPEINIDNMSDKTVYARFITEKKLKNFLISGFIKFNYTSISTSVKAKLIPADKQTKEKLEDYDLSKNLDRDEYSFNAGFNISYGKNYFVEFEYYYTRIFRDSDLGYINYNHVVSLDFIKPMNRQWFIYIGGKAMYRQFNGEIPYLYNKYTQTTFDHKYGWARAGIGFVF